ncbi:MAG: DUF695 domain-containing protein [Hyphomonas sp.]|nr:DUF695 domain-containing protein [Hyphomonas sp.]
MGAPGAEDDWDFYPLLVDDAPASIMVNLAYRQVLPVPNYSEMAYVHLHMRQPREDGLSSNVEFETLSALDVALTGLVEAEGESLYVGRNTSGGCRDFYFYTRDAKRFERAAQNAMASFPAYEFELGTRPDADWSTYTRFLYPSPNSMQRIQNRRVCDQLKQHGDDLTISRTIDHFATFGSERAARTFADECLAEGYQVARVEQLDDHSGEWGVWFERSDKPSEIDDVVIPLFTRIAELEGNYDGWGCVAQTPE